MEDLNEGLECVLIANNTIFRCGSGLCLWDNEPYKKYTRGQVEVCNNLLAEAAHGDALFIHGLRGSLVGPGDGNFLVRLWRFARNGRDQSGASVKGIMPLAPRDRLLEQLDLASREPSHADFLRRRFPACLERRRRSRPVSADLRRRSPSGGVPPWDWDWTWRSRVGREEREGIGQAPEG